MDLAGEHGTFTASTINDLLKDFFSGPIRHWNEAVA